MSPIFRAGRTAERKTVVATDVQPVGSYVRHALVRCHLLTLGN